MPRLLHDVCRACCILPPHILVSICENGTAEERQQALKTLMLSERLRERRGILALFAAVVPAGEERRTVYDAKHRTALPGVLVRGEGDPPSADPAVNEAYDGAGATYDLYEQVYGRNSIDG
jgi:Zn-dependent metalloprotease